MTLVFENKPDVSLLSPVSFAILFYMLDRLEAELLIVAHGPVLNSFSTNSKTETVFIHLEPAVKPLHFEATLSTIGVHPRRQFGQLLQPAPKMLRRESQRS